MNPLDEHLWYILPGRRVAHAFRPGDHRGVCGMTGSYKQHELLEASPSTRKCEACLMSIVTNVNAQLHKFFAGYVPAGLRRRRSKEWKAFLNEHPEYGPPSWRDHSIGKVVP